jgi:hypothetical protein
MRVRSCGLRRKWHDAGRRGTPRDPDRGVGCVHVISVASLSVEHTWSGAARVGDMTARAFQITRPLSRRAGVDGLSLTV